MDEHPTAAQRLAQVLRTLWLVNFRLMQLRQTNDQLLAGLQDLVVQTSLAAEAEPALHGEVRRPLFRKDFPS
jgi:hypothetical protein